MAQSFGRSLDGSTGNLEQPSAGTGTGDSTSTDRSGSPCPAAGTGRRPAVVVGVALAGAVIVAAAVIAVTAPVAHHADTTPNGVQGQPLTNSSPSSVVRSRVDGLLDAHAAALLAGDEQGWLDVADPTKPDVMARYRQLYATLRALRVSWFRYRVPPEVANGRPGPRPEQITIEYCLGNVACNRDTAASARMHLLFTERGGRWWVSGIADPADRAQLPDERPPWLADPLQVTAQGGVIVAAAPALAGRIDAVVTAAVKATTIVNRYSRPGTTPPTYLIYLATPTQWNTWYGGLNVRDTVVGVTTTQSPVQISVVVRMDRLDPTDLDLLLRHEMGHVITGFGEPDNRNRTRPPPSNNWAAEGVAEYIAWTDQPRSQYPRLAAIRSYLRAGRWNGTLPITIDDTDNRTVDATYGLNYLAIRYLADHYGEQTMLRLIDDLLRNGNTIDKAAPAVLGQPWPTLAAEIAAHLKTAAQ